MAFLAVNPNGAEMIFDDRPRRYTESYYYRLRDNVWKRMFWGYDDCIEGETFVQRGIELPQGTIAKLIGQSIAWIDEPVELKGTFID